MLSHKYVEESEKKDANKRKQKGDGVASSYSKYDGEECANRDC
jgi:hypothetical protein